MPSTSHRSQRTALSWYWRRLKSAPPAELPYRIGQLAKAKLDKYLARPGKQESCAPTGLKIYPLDVSALFDARPTLLPQVKTAADKIVDHKFDIFGIPVDFGRQINWHLDPKTLRSWPLIFWADINYRDGKAVGGIKFAWELNRLHHMPLLAIARATTKERKYEDEIFAQLRSWLDANPYPKGINWISGIELGIRLVNLVYTLKALSEPISDENRAIVSEFVNLHATHLRRYPSKYTSAANHTLAEALGLFAAGTTFPDLKDSSKWKEAGKTILECEVTRQIYPDGSSFEHSFPYLQFVVDHYLIYFFLCREHGLRCGEQVIERLKTSLKFIDTMLDSNGNYPAIGDDDSGYLLKLWIGEHNNFISLLNTGAILFDEPHWSGKRKIPDAKTLLLLGRDAQSKWPDPKASADISLNRYHRDAGLAVFKRENPVELLFVGNSSRLGLRPLAAHGHADALSFWLSIAGMPVLVDAGTYLYHSGGKWRDYFRSTAAHNTVRVDKLDQATIVSDFIFADFYEVFDDYLTHDGDRTVWTAKHSGYQRLPDPVTHGRTITYIASEARFSIDDELTCNGPHWIECYFHFHPDCHVSVLGDSVQISLDGIAILMSLDSRWQLTEVLYGDQNCSGGWYSRGFNQIEETATVRLSAEIPASASFSTSIRLPHVVA